MTSLEAEEEQGCSSSFNTNPKGSLLEELSNI